MNLVWVWLALASVARGLTALIVGPSAVSNSMALAALGPWVFLWEVAFLIAGLLLLWGILGLKPEIEALGHSILAGAIFIYTAALVMVGLVGVSTWLLPALALASISKVILLTSAAQVSAKLKADGKPSSKSTTLMSVAVIPASLLIAASEGLSTALVIPFLALLFGGGGVAAYMKIKPESNELTARTADAITAAADRIITRQEIEIQALRKEVAELRSVILHQQSVDSALATCQASLTAASQAVGRLDHRVNTLTAVLQDAGVKVPLTPDPPRSGEGESPGPGQPT